MWIAGTCSTPALTQNARRIQFKLAFLNFPARAGGRRGRDRAETPGLIGRGFLHLHNDSLGKRRLGRGRAQWPADALSRCPVTQQARRLRRNLRLQRQAFPVAALNPPPCAANQKITS
jgi:hypothetical protein